MQTMTTNEVFHHLTIILCLHRDKEFLIEIFKNAGVHDISKAKIDSWRAKSESADKYREMPRIVLDAFIDELYKMKLVQV
jgi:uncharacterized protein YehS (DUF1456 family)